MDTNTYTVSKHCKERYVERLMSKSDNNERQRYIVENEEKITDYINKLIQHGNLIYSGKQTQKDSKGNIIDIFLKDTWCILADNKNRNVITVYKIDLGCGDEFNLQYIDKMIEKLNKSKDNLASITKEIETESIMYKEMINSSTSQINEYKTMIKNLESLCNAYQEIINNNIVKISQANKEVAEVVNTLIGRKEF